MAVGAPHGASLLLLKQPCLLETRKLIGCKNDVVDDLDTHDFSRLSEATR